jgi:SAM-dependent methyltransferase
VLWSIPELPFIYRPLPTPANPPGLPNSLPFRLGVDEVTGRLVQLPSDELADVLDRAYADGTMITGFIDESGIGREYAEDFLDYVTEETGRERIDGLRVLEIGCGTGYLLHRLHERGAEVRGVEPGPSADEGTERFGIRIDRGYYPAVGVGTGYDLVVLYCVLEHLPDPAALLRDVAEAVAPGGRVVVAVPDEEPYIASGDYSMLFHEHYSYFTARTLRRSVVAAGGSDVRVRRSRFTNLLMASYRPAEESDDVTHEDDSDDVTLDLELARRYRDRATLLVAAVGTELDAVRAAGGTLGVFVPARAANALVTLGADAGALRFFDDNAELTGTYYPGIDVVVEDRSSLLADPPHSVLVMSLTFGERIASSLRAELPDGVPVRPLSDLIEGSVAGAPDQSGDDGPLVGA